jgi:hypothetical protein
MTYGKQGRRPDFYVILSYTIGYATSDVLREHIKHYERETSAGYSNTSSAYWKEQRLQSYNNAMKTIQDLALKILETETRSTPLIKEIWDDLCVDPNYHTLTEGQYISRVSWLYQIIPSELFYPAYRWVDPVPATKKAYMDAKTCEESFMF